MAGIQQSINQMLYTGTIGVGLYAGTPSGARKVEARQLKKDIPRLEKMREQQAEKDIDTEAANAAYSEVVAAEERASKRLYELDPTDENYKAMLTSMEGKEEFEQLLEQSYTKRALALEDQKEQFKVRRELVKNAGMQMDKEGKVIAPPTARKTKIDLGGRY